MLPVEVGNLVLSNDAHLRVETYFHRFCMGENGRLHGLEHMVFACHAAFPLLTSPKLANLIRLNFNAFVQHGQPRNINPIVVSDFLLSPLLRPVANRQYEMLPEIRTYLLYLLKSGNWLASLGIDRFHDDRLQTLAHFLYQYCASDQSLAEHDILTFREANHWAALAYLEPEILALEIATAFQDTFGPAEDQTDGHRQLQLNTMLDRLGQQINLDIHKSESKEAAAFVNLQRYSRANRAQLFEEDGRHVSDLFYELDQQFIEKSGDPQHQVELPIQPAFHERLERKKARMTRIFPVLVAAHEPQASDGGYAGSGVEVLERWFSSYRYPSSEVGILTLRAGHDATRDNILEQLDEVLRQAEPEDVVFVCLAGTFSQQTPREEACFLCWAQTRENTYTQAITPADLKHLFSRHNTGNRIMLLLDGDTDFVPWLETGADILARGYASMDAQFGYLSGLLADVLQQYEHALSFRDLQLLLEEAHAERSNRFSPAPTVYVQDRKNWLQAVFTYGFHDMAGLPAHLPAQQDTDNDGPSSPWADPILVYNPSRAKWNLLDEGFLVYPVSMVKVPVAVDYAGHGKPYSIDTYFSGGEGGFSLLDDRESLNHHKLYKPVIDHTPLYFSIDGDADDAKLQEIRAMLEAAPRMIYTLAPALYESPALAQDNHLRIFKREVNGSFRFEVRFLAQHDDEPEFRWAVNEEADLLPSITAFGRYQYLKSLQYPSPGGRHYGQDRAHPQANKSLYDYYRIVDGKIQVLPFDVELRSQIGYPAYAQLYALSGHDLSVKRIGPEIIRIENERPLLLTIDEPGLLMTALRHESQFHIKVLTSTRPMFPDFSQAGVAIETL